MTAYEAALWMKSVVDQEGMLTQFEAASALIEHEDDGLAYYDDDGNLCIGKSVLAEFRKITPEVVYLRSDKAWRPREPYDLPGRQQ